MKAQQLVNQILNLLDKGEITSDTEIYINTINLDGSINCQTLDVLVIENSDLQLYNGEIFNG